MSSRSAGAPKAGSSPFARGYGASGAAVPGVESPEGDIGDAVKIRDDEAPTVSWVQAGGPRPGIDVRWIVALFLTGIALMIGAALIYKAGWLAQGAGDYAVDSYGEVYSAQSGRTLDDIVFEDFMFTVNPYLFALGAATAVGTLFLLATRGVNRRGE